MSSQSSTPPPPPASNENVTADSASNSQQRNELKRYKAKSKTDFILSSSTNALPNAAAAAAETRKTGSGSENDNEANSNLGVGMSIQERLAALKKSGEEEWKKRSVMSTNAEEPAELSSTSHKPVGSVSGLIKQQQEQLKQQLQIGLNKNLSQQCKLSGNPDSKRAILAPLSDNKLSNEDAFIDSTIQEESKSEKRSALISKRIMLNPFQPSPQTNAADDLNSIDSQKPSRPKPQAKMVRMHSAGSDTDTIFARNASKISSMLANSQKKPKSTAAASSAKKSQHNESTVERVELFSTDSEMDSFFKENDAIVKSNYLLLSSSGGSSPNKNTDENTMNEDMDDDIEFDRIVSEAQR